MPSDNVYDYACLMVQFKFAGWENLQNKLIDERDLYVDDSQGGFGLEDEPHVTILYGLHEEVRLEDVKKHLIPLKKIKGKLTNISYFEPNDYDVLKFDVESPYLNMLNKRITDNFPFTSDFPDYHPHMTIAYLNKGTGKKYTRELNEPIIVTPYSYKYSYPSGEAKYFKI